VIDRIEYCAVNKYNQLDRETILLNTGDGEECFLLSVF